MTSSGTVATSLTDAETCGEDLAHNLKRMITVAPATCAGCSDYHIFNAAKRLSGHTPWSHGARGYLFDTLAPLFADLAGRAEDRFDVVVAACADTAILSTCVHAVWRQNKQLLSRVRFTVLDRCRSPLVLCEEYAARHGLEVRTETVDLLDTSASFPADLIVLHNFLPFVPMERHALLMKTLHGWLKPHGKLYMWNTVLAAEDHEAIALRWKAQIAAVKSMIEAGTIEINEPKEVLFARLDRNVADTRPGMRRCADIESMKALIASAGLRTKSIEEISKTRRERGTSYIKVVAERPPEA